ncbi:S-adenosyl-L-methionine-dependent methyltransferase [Chaetomidium leptoderma]|uniref:S-adenosyl-L-methionine-dependent methyltransferase n=1 Tax=Chaetomidium leptoderma TaxID=669021 RepID=A0AAN6VIA7_9PEZI|nr:S-adenosyl-L-methionine-dependent methyltransferase [Chaetomidium leptoderma]
MSAAAASRATELHKLFHNFKGALGSGWEDVILENARRVSTPLAVRLLSQMGVDKDTNTPFKLLENACGAGVVAPVLQQTVKPEVLKQSSIVCGDFSDQVIGLAKRRMESEGWINTEVTKVDAQKIPFADGAFTHVATNIGFHVVPDSEAALNEAIRILQPGGILGFTTWHKEAGWFIELRRAFKSFPFEAPCEMGLQTTEWGDWSDVNWVRETLVGKGLRDVNVDLLAFTSHVDSPAFFVENCKMMMDWVMTSCWSEELRKEHPKEEVFQMVREVLDKKYGDGGWEATWVGLVATGRVA